MSEDRRQCVVITLMITIILTVTLIIIRIRIRINIVVNIVIIIIIIIIIIITSSGVFTQVAELVLGCSPNARTPSRQHVHNRPEQDVKLLTWLVKQLFPSLMSRGWRSMCHVCVGRQKVTSLAALAGGSKVEGSNSDQASVPEKWCARQRPIGRRLSSGLRGLRPCGRRSMCQVLVGRQRRSRLS